ncbi:MAG: riboflavin synthase [Betaproteobacteria bacterium HGW-Betaproteobacteria-11]|nr:MAG: riboflavin synthase [Betaproteobacteria bacterium HGW-Betaproteobacteria-11]
MFTGIIAAVGRISHVQALGQGLRLTVEAPALDLSDVALGDSIAHGGVCLTVIGKSGSQYQVDVSAETLACACGLAAPGPVNLEKALRLADRLGGHLVSGHVDGLGTVLSFAPVGESHALVVRVPPALAKYVARKGSLTVDGVSLTTNRVTDGAEGAEGCEVSINLIPHTLAVTTLGNLAAGHQVNLEVDLIARYCERMLESAA